MSKLKLRIARPHVANAASDRLVRLTVTPGNFAKVRAVSFELDCDATVASRTCYLRQYKETSEVSGAGLFTAYAWATQTAGQSHHHTVLFGRPGSLGDVNVQPFAHGAAFEQIWTSPDPIFEGEFTLAFGAENLQAGDAWGSIEIQYWDGPLDLVALAI